MDAITGINTLGLSSPLALQTPLLTSGISGYGGLGLAQARLGGADLSGLSGLTGLSGVSGLNLNTASVLQQNANAQGVMLQVAQLLMSLMAAQSGTSASGSPDALGALGGSGGGGGGVASSGGGGGSSSAAPAGNSGNIGQAPAADSADEGEVKSFISKAAGVYGADPKVLSEIARRESGYKAGAVNNWDSNAKKGTPSKGMFQFIESTFKSYAEQAKKDKPEAWKDLGELNWMDWRQQALACSWAITHGHGSAWSTYTAAGGK